MCVFVSVHACGCACMVWGVCEHVVSMSMHVKCVQVCVCDSISMSENM